MSPQRPRGSSPQARSAPHANRGLGSARPVRPVRPVRPSPVSTAAVLFCLAVIGCGAATDPPAASPPVPGSTVATTATASTERVSSGSSVPKATGLEALHPLSIDESRWTADELAMIEGYVAAELASVKAEAVSDPDDPDLGATHVDPMLAQRRRIFEANRAAGHAARLPDAEVFAIRPERIEMIDADNARLWVCESANGATYEVATGKVLDDRTTSVRWLTGMTRANDMWRLAERVEHGRWEGASGCGEA